MHELAMLVIPVLVAIPYFALVTLPEPIDEVAHLMEQVPTHGEESDVIWHYGDESDS